MNLEVLLNIKQAFAIVLKEARKAQGISQEALALDANLDRSFLSKIERAINQPSLETLFAIARVLGCTPHYLIIETEIKMNSPDKNQVHHN